MKKEINNSTDEKFARSCEYLSKVHGIDASEPNHEPLFLPYPEWTPPLILIIRNPSPKEMLNVKVINYDYKDQLDVDYASPSSGVEYNDILRELLHNKIEVKATMMIARPIGDPGDTWKPEYQFPCKITSVSKDMYGNQQQTPIVMRLATDGQSLPDRIVSIQEHTVSYRMNLIIDSIQPYTEIEVRLMQEIPENLRK
ncbi:MAG: hypothetical protein COA79_20435 [Planctomycetota bacterium]|nr:MAG: hypothetical protein COA79_20435 [Planctomycetota bacterium]